MEREDKELKRRKGRERKRRQVRGEQTKNEKVVRRMKAAEMSRKK